MNTPMKCMIDAVLTGAAGMLSSTEDSCASQDQLYKVSMHVLTLRLQL